jgi:hypothetical protein
MNEPFDVLGLDGLKRLVDREDRRVDARERGMEVYHQFEGGAELASVRIAASIEARLSARSGDPWRGRPVAVHDLYECRHEDYYFVSVQFAEPWLSDPIPPGGVVERYVQVTRVDAQAWALQNRRTLDRGSISEAPKKVHRKRDEGKAAR